MASNCAPRGGFLRPALKGNERLARRVLREEPRNQERIDMQFLPIAKSCEWKYCTLRLSNPTFGIMLAGKYLFAKRPPRTLLRSLGANTKLMPIFHCPIFKLFQTVYSGEAICLTPYPHTLTVILGKNITPLFSSRDPFSSPSY